jgi:polar amino acid transport system substrate-binding protein
MDGFSIALTEAVLAGMGIQVTKPAAPYPWARALALTETGQADVVVSALWTEERTRWGYYPHEPLLLTRYALFGRAGDTLAPKSAAAMRDLRLGVVYRFQYTDAFIEHLPKSVTVVTAFTPEANLENLLRGLVDVAIEDQYTAQHLIRRRGWQDRIASEPLFRLSAQGFYAVFSRKTVTAAQVDTFSRRLSEYKQTPAYRELAARYGVAP